MANNTFSPELDMLLDYIVNNMGVKPQDMTSFVFVKSVMRTRNTLAYKAMERNMLNEGFVSLTDICDKHISVTNAYDKIEFATIMSQMERSVDPSKVTSADVLLRILEVNESIMTALTMTGTTYEQIKISAMGLFDGEVHDEFPEQQEEKEEKERPQRKTKVQVKRAEPYEKGDAERYLENINDKAAKGRVPKVFGNDDIINRIFTILSKRERNNVIIVGEPGVGKSATVEHIANLLVEGEVPEAFVEKKLLRMDFSSLLIGTGMRGGFEAKLSSIINDAVKKGRYIFYIDDIQTLFSPGARSNDIPTDSILETILSENSIQFICTASQEAYMKYIQPNSYISRRLYKITMEEKKKYECENILKAMVSKLSAFHNVAYDDETIKDAVRYSSVYITDRKLPDSAIDVLDEAGAMVSMSKTEDNRVVDLKKRLSDIESEKEEVAKGAGSKNYERYDELTKEEIAVKGELALLKKELRKKNEKPAVTPDDIRKVVSEKTGVPVNDMDSNERQKLKGIEDRINSVVIGQREAVNKVCRVVRRQRAGIANREKPVVIMMCGQTGVGKTFLAKTLARELFGDEGKLVRLDMSEYSEKMSVNRLYGSSAGYVGYEDGGILTEAIKKNRRCVLLLDEIEKANDEVFNVFLQVFDEGRLTDNRGVVVDFRDTVILMTSNIGSKEIVENGKGIGFVKGKEGERDFEIVKGAIKKKFKPEFVNRIDDIIAFNRLGDEDLRAIIKLEIGKVGKRIEDLGYKLSEDIVDGKMVDIILDNIKEESDFGARPVIREVQHLVEDGLTDYIIDNNPEKGYCFTLEDIYQ